MFHTSSTGNRSYGYFTIPPPDDEPNKVSYDISEEISTTLVIGYHIIVPCCAAIGIILNVLCMRIIYRPKLKNIHINKYLKFLVVMDLITSTCCLLDCLVRPFCFPRLYALAFYKVHFGGKLVYLCRYIQGYGLIWLSFDRFCATWFTKTFPFYKKPGAVEVRLVTSVIWAICWGIPILYMGRVENVPPHYGIENETKWLPNPVYTQHFNEKFLWIFLYCDVILNTIIPGVTLIGLNIGLMIGVAVRLLGTGMSREVSKTAAVLVINILFTVMHIPIFFINTSEHCVNVTVKELIWEICVDSFFIIWSIVNLFIIFAFNREYRNELSSTISLKYECQTNTKHSTTWCTKENLTTKVIINQTDNR